MHGRGGGAEVVGEVFGEGLEGGFGSVVGRVAGRVGDALLAAGDDDCGRRRAGAEGGQERGEAVYDAEEVRVHYLRVIERSANPYLALMSGWCRWEGAECVDMR